MKERVETGSSLGGGGGDGGGGERWIGSVEVVAGWLAVFDLRTPKGRSSHGRGHK